MHFNNQVLKVGTFDGILFSFFFVFVAGIAALFFAGDNHPLTVHHPLAMHHPSIRPFPLALGVVAQVVTNWGAAAIKFYN